MKGREILLSVYTYQSNQHAQQTESLKKLYLSNEIVVQEYVGRSSQHGIVRGVLSLGLEEGVR